ncbi:unnamed protein product, partial [Ectocarpus sp. 12 AP-2014]
GAERHEKSRKVTGRARNREVVLLSADESAAESDAMRGAEGKGRERHDGVGSGAPCFSSTQIARSLMERWSTTHIRHKELVHTGGGGGKGGEGKGSLLLFSSLLFSLFSFSSSTQTAPSLMARWNTTNTHQTHREKCQREGK